MNEQFIIDALESALGGSSFFNDVEQAGCTSYISVDNDLIPSIHLDTDRDDISVSITTSRIISTDGDEGYEFIPHISTEMVEDDFNLNTADDLLDKFDTWNKIVNICDQIYSVEFYPNNYEE